jgi:hypothetical protein
MTTIADLGAAEPVPGAGRLPIETPNLPSQGKVLAPAPGSARDFEPGNLTQDPIGVVLGPIEGLQDPLVPATADAPRLVPARLGDQRFLPVEEAREAPGPMVDHAIVPIHRSAAIPSGADPTTTGPISPGNLTQLPIAFPDLPGPELSPAIASGGMASSPAAVAIELPRVNGDRLITAPVPDLPENNVVPAAPSGAVGAAIQSVISGAANQTHQLVAAIASFAGEQASPLTSAIAQHEVDAARTTLAANLHF